MYILPSARAGGQVGVMFHGAISLTRRLCKSLRGMKFNCPSQARPGSVLKKRAASCSVRVGPWGFLGSSRM